MKNSGFRLRRPFRWFENSILLAVALFWIGSGSIPEKADAKSLDFVVDNTTFIKNLEYNDISEVVKGETLTGDIIKPYFTYRIREDLKFNAGAVLNVPFGSDDRVDTADPLVSLHYDFHPGWRFTAGTLNRNHPLLDALFNDDLEFTDPVEQGFQVRARTKHVRQDIWLDWEQQEKADRREKFSIGNYTQLRWGGFAVDVQVLWNHQGGQQNDAGEVANNVGIAFGGEMAFGPPPEVQKPPLVEQFGFKAHFIYTDDQPRSLTDAVQPDSTAHGILGEAFVVIGGANIFLKVWEATRDIDTDNGQTLEPPPYLGGIRADKGDPLYRDDDFIQIGFSKTWKITDEVDILTGIEVTSIRDQIVHVDTLSVRWRGFLPLWKEKANLEMPNRKSNASHWKQGIKSTSPPGKQTSKTQVSSEKLPTAQKKISTQDPDQSYRARRLSR